MTISNQNIPLEVRRITQDTPSPEKRALESGLKITWSSGEESSLDSKTLRRNCPCAECLAKRPLKAAGKEKPSGRLSLKIVKSEENEETNLLKVWAIGNYALGLQWGDGHDSGIYTYELLRTLSAEQG